jgi:hypothetical protein
VKEGKEMRIAAEEKDEESRAEQREVESRG